MNTHVLPIDDLKEHKESTECWCEPKVTQEADELLVVHNSADHREYFEPDRRKVLN